MSKEFSEVELAGELKSLPEWEVSVSELPGKESLKRAELKRTYKFASFEDAIDFMKTAAGHISKVNHHPRWENNWRTITVWLSTWDAGFKPTQLDLELAHYLDNLHQNYKG